MANTEYRVDPELPDEDREELDGWFNEEDEDFFGDDDNES